MRDRDTPLPLLRKWLRSCPDAYEQLDRCLCAKADGVLTWPDDCLLPINSAYTYLVYVRSCSSIEAAGAAAELTACWAWRRSRIIYAVDADMAAMLYAQADDMSDADTLPVDLLLHLPYPCIYVKAPRPDLPEMDGFFAWIDYDTNHGTTELRVQWVYSDMQGSVPQVLHIVPSGTIGDCTRATLERTQENVGADLANLANTASMARIVLGAIQILLYIVSAGADIGAAPDHKYTRKDPTKPTDVGKASTVDLQYVGVRMGAAIRSARSRAASDDSPRTAGSQKRPHSRRGHWHHYWAGPQDDRRLILKWTAPTYIHADDMPADGETVIYPIHK